MPLGQNATNEWMLRTKALLVDDLKIVNVKFHYAYVIIIQYYNEL